MEHIILVGDTVLFRSEKIGIVEEMIDNLCVILVALNVFQNDEIYSIYHSGNKDTFIIGGAEYIGRIIQVPYINGFECTMMIRLDD